MPVQITGTPCGSQIEIVCSECGPVAHVPAHLATLRMLAHYHHHQTAAD